MEDSKDQDLATLPAIQQEAVDKFGVTNNPYDAGFILSNGAMLSRPRNTTFHSYVEGEGSKPGDYAYKFLQSGAIRFSRQKQKGSDVASAELVQRPTSAQIGKLKLAVAGVYNLAIDFTDMSTRRPLIFDGKPVLLNTLIPNARKIDEFFSEVIRAIESR